MGKRGGKSSIVTRAKQEAAKPDKTRKELAKEKHERRKMKRPGSR